MIICAIAIQSVLLLGIKHKESAKSRPILGYRQDSKSQKVRDKFRSLERVVLGCSGGTDKVL